MSFFNFYPICSRHFGPPFAAGQRGSAVVVAAGVAGGRWQRREEAIAKEELGRRRYF